MILLVLVNHYSMTYESGLKVVLHFTFYALHFRSTYLALANQQRYFINAMPNEKWVNMSYKENLLHILFWELNSLSSEVVIEVITFR